MLAVTQQFQSQRPVQMMLEQVRRPEEDTRQHGTTGQDQERIGHDRRRFMRPRGLVVAVPVASSWPASWPHARRCPEPGSGAGASGSSGLGSFSGPQKVMK